MRGIQSMILDRLLFNFWYLFKMTFELQSDRGELWSNGSLGSPLENCGPLKPLGELRNKERGNSEVQLTLRKFLSSPLNA